MSTIQKRRSKQSKMALLFMIITLLAYSIANIHCVCPTPITTIEIETQQIIYGPPELIEAIFQDPLLRTQAQIALINNKIEEIKQLVSF